MRHDGRWKSSAKRVLLSAAFLAAIISRAEAVEFSTPLLPGSSDGTPLGAALPEGLYLSVYQVHWDSRAKNGSGQSLPTSFHFDETAPLLLYSSGMSIFGAKYSAFIVQPFDRDEYDYGSQLTNLGPYNTLITPVMLSWDLSNGVYASANFGVYLPDVKQHTALLNTGFGFLSYQPSFGLSYIKDGWDASVYLEFNLNETNPSTDYHTGNLLGLDYTLTKSMGKWTAGIIGYYTAQFQNDSLHGMSIAAGPLNSYGNRQVEVAVGPYIGYDFGNFSVAAWYDRSVYAKNGDAASIAYFKVSIPLGKPWENKPTYSSLPDRTQNGRMPPT